jgi:hypothetical protein
VAALLLTHEHERHPLQENGPPLREELRRKVILTTQLSTALAAGEEFEHYLGFELRCESTTFGHLDDPFWNDCTSIP